MTIVTTGYLNNLKALLQSGPDQYSRLNGMDLVCKKVKLWSCAGGCFPKGDEFNFRVVPDAAYHVVNNWPSAVMYVPDSMSGRPSIPAGGCRTLRRITRFAASMWTLRSSIPTLPGVRSRSIMRFAGRTGLVERETHGHNNADKAGSNWWSKEKDPPRDQAQGYLLEKARTPIRAGINALIMLPPNNGSPSRPGQPTNLRATVVGGNRVDLQWTDNAYNESGFRIERKINGVYTQIATVGANVTRYSDTGLSATANSSYRVKAYNSVGDSDYSYVWIYSGWTEVNLVNPTNLPIYTYCQSSNLRMRDGDFRPDHVTLNNDSHHGRDVTINVDVSALGHEGNFYVYFFYQDKDDWYRLNFGEKSCRFEKRINGTITQIGWP